MDQKGWFGGQKCNLESNSIAIVQLKVEKLISMVGHTYTHTTKTININIDIALTRPGNLVDTIPLIQPLGGKGVWVTELLTEWQSHS